MPPQHLPQPQHRTCTDIPCTILFLLTMMAWMIVALIANSKGSITRLLQPSDTDGNICGISKKYVETPYVLFFDLSKCARFDALYSGCHTPQMCVEKCPNDYFYGALPYVTDGSTFSRETEDRLKAQLKYCVFGVDRTGSYLDLVDGYHCAAWYVPSHPVNGRCLPNTIGDLTVHTLANLSKHLRDGVVRQEQSQLLMVNSSSSQTTNTTQSNNTRVNQMTATGLAMSTASEHWSPRTSDGTNITKAMLSTAKTVLDNMHFMTGHFWMLVSVSLLVPLLLSLLYIGLLRWYVKAAVVVGHVGAVLALVVIAVLCGLHYNALHRYEEAPDAEYPLDDDYFSATKRHEAGMKIIYFMVAIGAGALALIVLVTTIALRKKFAVSIALLKQCNLTLRDMSTMFFIPIISVALQVLVLLWFLFVFLTLLSIMNRWQVHGDCITCYKYSSDQLCYPDDFNKHCKDSCPNAYCRNWLRPESHILAVVAMAWAVGFIGGVSKIAVAMCFTKWYFSRTSVFALTVPLSAYANTLMYHMGTAAFGSVALSVCQLMYWPMKQLRRWLAKIGGRPNDCCTTGCCCCCRLLQHCIQFMNRRAYIMAALEGTELCAAARKSMLIVTRNVSTATAVDSFSHVVLGLGKLMVVLASVLLVHIILFFGASRAMPWLLPTGFSALMAHIIALSVFSIYEMGVESLVFCAMVDLDINDGGTRRPYMMSMGMARALGITLGELQKTAVLNRSKHQNHPSLDIIRPRIVLSGIVEEESSSRSFGQLSAATLPSLGYQSDEEARATPPLPIRRDTEI